MQRTGSWQRMGDWCEWKDGSWDGGIWWQTKVRGGNGKQEQENLNKVLSTKKDWSLFSLDRRSAFDRRASRQRLRYFEGEHIPIDGLHVVGEESWLGLTRDGEGTLANNQKDRPLSTRARTACRDGKYTGEAISYYGALKLREMAGPDQKALFPFKHERVGTVFLSEGCESDKTHQRICSLSCVKRQLGWQRNGSRLVFWRCCFFVQLLKLTDKLEKLKHQKLVDVSLIAVLDEPSLFVTLGLPTRNWTKMKQKWQTSNQRIPW